MARQSPNRPEADEPAADVSAAADSAGTGTTASSTTDTSAAENGTAGSGTSGTGTSGTGTSGTGSSGTGSSLGASTRTGAVPADAGNQPLWSEARILPVEIALPGGVGVTLRAYRRASELTPTEVDSTADEDPFDARERAAAARIAAENDDDEEVVILDEEYAALLADEDPDAKGPDAKDSGARSKGKDVTPEDPDAPEPDPADFEDEADKEVERQAAEEEVPAFLSHRGRLLLFKSPESLVSFIRSGAPHDLAQLDSWPMVAERVQTTDIAPLDEDSYELDLVVENLRGGHDTWDLPLLIAAGEIARDLGHALRLKPVIMALSAGSPLDDLDDALRSAANGGMSGFFGKRRLRKFGAQQASLGWRSIIGKISGAVDWRD